jgi:urea transport system permease protein
MAGVAGALYVPQVGIINPSEFSPANSIEIVIWVALGGRGTLYGAALGAVVVNFAKSYFTGAIPDLWLFALGGLFIFVTIFMPKGIVGTIGSALSYGRSTWNKRRSEAPADFASRPIGEPGE